MASALPSSTSESPDCVTIQQLGQTTAVLNVEILETIECPTCLESMIGNIYMCELGHSICHKCRWNVRTCPVCRRNLTNRRNYMLESVTKILYYPCTYDGCDKLNKRKHLVAHHLDCDYKPYPCILDKNCKWLGPRIQIKSHILEKHDCKAWMRNENLDKWKETSGDSVQAIIAFENVFYIYTKHVNVDDDPSKSFVYWGVQYIGQTEKAKNFEYIMNIYTDVNNRDITFREVCHSDNVSIDQIIETGRCVCLTVKQLKTFINEYKCVWFKLAIIELGAETT